MLTRTLLQSLTDDIDRWLAGAPSWETLIDYVKAVPDAERDDLELVASGLADRLYDSKQAYFEKAGAASFCTDVPEHTQRTYLEYLSHYDSASVLSRLQSELGIQLGFTAFPADIASWSSAYLTRWDLIVSLSVAPTYLTNCLYAESLVGVTAKQSDRSLAELREQFLAVLRREDQYEKAGQLTSRSELGGDERLLDSLGFFPKEFTAKYLDEGQDISRYELMGRLVDILSLILELGPAASEPERLRSALWDQLYILAEGSLLDDFEAERLRSASYGQAVGGLVDWLSHVWTVENVLSGQAAQVTAAYFAKMGDADRQRFLTIFEEFAGSLGDISAAFDPVAPEVIVGGLRQAADIQSARHLGSVIPLPDEEPEQYEDLRDAYIESIWKVFHLP